MFRMKRIVPLVALVALTAFSSGCASNDETPGERRALELEDDNENLRRQIEDHSAAENALSRELDAKRGESGRLENELASLRDENARLRSRRDELGRQLAEARNAAPAVKPASVNANGLSGKDIEVVERDDGSVLLRLSGTVMFETAQDRLTVPGRKMLDRVASIVRSDNEVMISIEGHTDARPLGKTKEIWGTNLALSLARAMSVQDYLKTDRKIAEKRMRVVGYGEHRPVVPGKSEKAHARNRRVEIVLYRE